MNNELYHYGKLGMKWGQHKAKVQVKREKQKRRDSEILNARLTKSLALDDYNYKARYANRHMDDKKASDDVYKAFDRYVKLAEKSKQKTNKEKNKDRTLAIMASIGAVSYASAVAYYS